MYNEYLKEELLFEYKGKNGGGEQRTHNPILLRFVILLVVCHKALRAGPHMFALHTMYQNSCHLCGYIRIFRLVFKIPSAER